MSKHGFCKCCKRRYKTAESRALAEARNKIHADLRREVEIDRQLGKSERHRAESVEFRING